MIVFKYFNLFSPSATGIYRKANVIFTFLLPLAAFNGQLVNFSLTYFQVCHFQMGSMSDFVLQSEVRNRRGFDVYACFFFYFFSSRNAIILTPPSFRLFAQTVIGGNLFFINYLLLNCRDLLPNGTCISK